MKYRVFKHDGLVLDRVDGTSGEAFGSDDAVAIAEVAAQLDVPEREITVEERAEPPARFDKAIPQPPPAVQPPTTEERLNRVLEILTGLKSLDAEERAALEEIKAL